MEAIHPGGHLAEELKQMDMSAAEFARQIRVPTNRVTQIISTKFPIDDPEDGIVGVCGIATDITTRKEVEAASLDVAAMVEGSDDAIVSKDLNGTITSVEPSCRAHFRLTAAEVVGKPTSILAAPDRPNEMPQILHKGYREGERVEHYETVRRKKNGETIHVSPTVSPVRDVSGRIVGASKIARDISDLERVENERVLLLARGQKARRTVKLLNRISPMLVAGLDLEKLVQSVTEVATKLVGSEFGLFFHNAVNEQGESYMLYTLSSWSKGERQETGC